MKFFKLKKLAGLVLAAAVVVTGVIGATGNTAEAAGAPTVKLEAQASSVTAGDELKVNVVLSNNPGVAFFSVTDIKYDDTKLDLIEIKNTGVMDGSFTGAQTLDSNPFSLVWSIGTSDDKDNGTIATLTFKAVEDTSGAANITIGSVEAFNVAFDEVNVENIDGSVTVVEKHNHAATGDWQFDKTHHWKECSCGEDLDKAAHTWDAGKVTTQPTEKAEGVKTYTCTVCKATKTEAIAKLNHTHDLKDGWKAEGGYHWQECNGCNEKVNYGKCEAGADGLCKVCGTKVETADEGTTDDGKQETSPNTGDTATAALWFVVIAAAVVVVGGTRMRKSVR
ncbi:MAG: hypothetical protein IJ471_01725 [Eubacterium sp.]|nr:hypothetical protein [Eubacterium sp.]